MDIHNCIHCGTETQAGWRFCRRCGTALEGLEDTARVADCGSCASPLAADWRFCFNCGTSAEGAVPQGAGSTAPAAAEPAPPAVETAPPPVPSAPLESAAATDAVTTEAATTETVAAEAAEALDPVAAATEAVAAAEAAAAAAAAAERRQRELEPAAEVAPAAEPEIAPPSEATDRSEALDTEPPQEWLEPTISARSVDFEPPLDEVASGDGLAAGAPPFADEDLPGDLQAPPTDSVVETVTDDLAAPPAPHLPDEPDSVAPGSSDDDSYVRSWQTARPDTTDADEAAARREFSISRDEAAPELTDTIPELDTPAVIIPPRQQDDDKPPVRTELPRPIGSAEAPPRELPQPVREETEPADTVLEPDSPAIVIPPRQEEQPAVRPEMPRPIASTEAPPRELPQPIREEPAPSWTPSQAESEAMPRADEEMVPIDARTFRNPGLFGQATQLAGLGTAALAVTMLVSHILLNNRIKDYATGSGRADQIESIESIINTWQRPLLILAVVGTFVAMVIWARRVVVNIAVFNKHVPEAALWMWAIPLVNIFVLRQHFDNAWRGSDVLLTDDPQWQRTRGNWWSLAFTALGLASAAVLFYGWTAGADSFEAAIDSNSLLMIGYFLLAAALLSAVRAMGDIIDRQGSRAKRFV